MVENRPRDSAFDEVLPAVHLREEVITRVSHELRTPLTSIIGYLELLDDLHRTAGIATPSDSGEADHILQVLRRNADLLLERITDLLITSAGPEDTHAPVPTDVSALVRLAMDKHEMGAAAHQVQLDLAVTEGITAEVDPLRVEQLLDSLVTNAVEFGSPGGHVVVQLQGDHDELRLTVSDDGVGMTADERLQVFELFYRAETASPLAMQGLGTGLGRVAAILARHRGRVEIDSAPGQGSTFDVLLPLHALGSSRPRAGAGHAGTPARGVS